MDILLHTPVHILPLTFYNTYAVGSIHTVIKEGLN